MTVTPQPAPQPPVYPNWVFYEKPKDDVLTFNGKPIVRVS